MRAGARILILSFVTLVALGAGALVYKTWPLLQQRQGGDTGHKVEAGEVVQVPFLFWGGDVATFHANGGLETTPDSLFKRHQIAVSLTPGDDFAKQVDDYLSGKSPFLRGTLSMLGQESERLTAKPETTPVVFLQLTWSAGDHLVGRSHFRSLNDLKDHATRTRRPLRIALQKNGPHVGMLNDILHTVKLEWKDVAIVWTDDVSGDKGPAERFRNDPSIDACFCISPEMYELTSAPEGGGLKATGDGTKKSVKGAHVVVSTAHMSRSIADVYACRKDFYDKNKDWVEKFVAGYLKASEEIVDIKNRAAARDKVAEERYKKVIRMAQDIWSKDPAFEAAVKKEDDVDGLISDAVFVGLPGNEAFFKGKGNLSGFEFKQAQAVELPLDPSVERPKVDPKKFQAHDLDYASIRRIGALQGRKPTKPRITASAEDLEFEETIYRFEIYFEKDRSDFPAEVYGTDFQRALDQASLFGNTAIVIRGHADPTGMVERFRDAALADGVIRRVEDTPLTYTVTADNSQLTLADTPRILELIKMHPQLAYTYQGRPRLVKDGVLDLERLSDRRAEEVRRSVAGYAQSRNLVLEGSQMRSQGFGIRDPLNGYPGDSEEERARNRRVEFRIVKVPEGKFNPEEFELEK